MYPNSKDYNVNAHTSMDGQRWQPEHKSPSQPLGFEWLLLHVHHELRFKYNRFYA